MNTQVITEPEQNHLEGNAAEAKEVALDEGLDETFPASDPVAITITPPKEGLESNTIDVR